MNAHTNCIKFKNYFSKMCGNSALIKKKPISREINNDKNNFQQHEYQPLKKNATYLFIYSSFTEQETIKRKYGFL